MGAMSANEEALNILADNLSDSLAEDGDPRWERWKGYDWSPNSGQSDARDNYILTWVL